MPLDPSLKLRPGLPTDMTAMADSFIDAFSGNTIGWTFIPRRAQPRSTFGRQPSQEKYTNQMPTSSLSQTPQITSPWPLPNEPRPYPRGTPAPPMPAQSEWPTNDDPKLTATFFKKDMHEEIMADRPHWYPEIIVTRRADDDGVEAYSDATPDGKPLYGKFGFVDVGTWPSFDDTYRHSFTLRKPGGTGYRRVSLT